MDWWMLGLALAALLALSAWDVGRPGRAERSALLLMRAVGGLGLIAMAALALQAGSDLGALVAAAGAAPPAAGHARRRRCASRAGPPRPAPCPRRGCAPPRRHRRPPPRTRSAGPPRPAAGGQPPVTGWRPPRWGRMSQRSMRSSTGWWRREGIRQPTWAVRSSAAPDELDRLVQVHRAAGQAHRLHGREQLAAQPRLAHVGEEERVLHRAAQVVEVDEHDERRDAPGLLRDRDDHLLLVGRVDRRRRPRGGRAGAEQAADGRGRGAGAVARGVPRRGGEAGRQDRRHREAGLAALLARLAEQRDERREVVGAALRRQLLHQRLDQVRAREAGDGPRHPVGVGGARAGRPPRRPRAAGRAGTPPGRRGRGRGRPRQRPTSDRAVGVGVRGAGRGPPTGADLVAGPPRDDGRLVEVLRVVRGDPRAQHLERLGAVAGARQDARQGAAAARHALGQVAVQHRQQPALDGGRLEHLLGGQQLGHLGLERVDLLVGQVAPRRAGRAHPAQVGVPARRGERLGQRAARERRTPGSRGRDAGDDGRRGGRWAAAAAATAMRRRPRRARPRRPARAGARRRGRDRRSAAPAPRPRCAPPGRRRARRRRAGGAPGPGRSGRAAPGRAAPAARRRRGPRRRHGRRP